MHSKPLGLVSFVTFRQGLNILLFLFYFIIFIFALWVTLDACQVGLVWSHHAD